MNGALIISSRQREVWLYENKKLLDRLWKMLDSADVALLLRCNNPLCPSPAIMIQDAADGSAERVLQCGCKTRYVEQRNLRKH